MMSTRRMRKMQNPSTAEAEKRSQSDVVALRPSDRILERVKRLHPKRMDLSLGRMERLLERLDHPEQKLPPVIHVAGTNGKGSTTAYLKAALEAAGYGVHVYTSPHLVRFNERIQLASADDSGAAAIEEAELEALLTECETANGEDPITFFEITTACAFLAFSRHPADFVLLEVGLGGRLDATNVIDKPLLTVLTSISIDHVQFLGEKLAGIAAEKAGILKAGVPCVAAYQSEAAMQPIDSRATEISAPLFTGGREWQVDETENSLAVTVGNQTTQYPLPALPGGHQIINAGLAVAVLKNLPGYDIGDEAISSGLKSASWPGRLQALHQSRAARHLPDGSELWLDGGHNEASGIALGETLDAWQTDDPRPTYAICGMLNVKDVSGFVVSFVGRIDRLYGIAIPGEINALPAADIAAQAETAGLDARPALSVIDALEAISARHRQSDAGTPPPRVLICGSLYLAGSVLAHEQDLVKQAGEFSN